MSGWRGRCVYTISTLPKMVQIVWSVELEERLLVLLLREHATAREVVIDPVVREYFDMGW